MRTFVPISFDDANLRAYKYTGSAAVREGYFCVFDSSNSTTDTFACKEFSTAGATLPTSGSGTVDVWAKGKFFPIYKEDPDIEQVAATISNGDYVVGFALQPGNEFKVHASAAHVDQTNFKGGNRVAIATSGKLAPAEHAQSSGVVVGECVATLGSWIFVRVL